MLGHVHIWSINPHFQLLNLTMNIILFCRTRNGDSNTTILGDDLLGIDEKIDLDGLFLHMCLNGAKVDF